MDFTLIGALMMVGAVAGLLWYWGERAMKHDCREHGHDITDHIGGWF